jgi:Zn-finger nucleic acid-binding protein
MSGGLTATSVDHPALRSVKAPTRCRRCFGWMMPDGRCAKCKEPLPSIDCPACGVTMSRHTQGKTTLDHCDPCGGTWFDSGELAEVYRIEPQKSLASRYIEQRAAESAAMAGAMYGRPGYRFGRRDGEAPGASFLGALVEIAALLVRLRF